MIDESLAETAENGDATDSCRLLGRRQAEELDQELRREESRQRDRRLAELADEPGRRPPGNRHRQADDEASLRIIQLETRLGELGTYVRTIHESRPWRAASPDEVIFLMNAPRDRSGGAPGR